MMEDLALYVQCVSALPTHSTGYQQGVYRVPWIPVLCLFFSPQKQQLHESDASYAVLASHAIREWEHTLERSATH